MHGVRSLQNLLVELTAFLRYAVKSKSAHCNQEFQLVSDVVR